MPATSIYGAMHIYALSKLWLALPHSAAIAYAIVVAGLMMTLSPFILWQISRQSWHGTTVVLSWVTYLWMGFLFLFCCIALTFDFVQLISTAIDIKWPLDDPTKFLALCLLAVALMVYGFFSARQIQLEKITITTPKLSPDIGKVTIAQISDLHLGVMLGDEFLQRVIARLHELKPDIIVATGDVVDGQGDDFNALSKPFLNLKPRYGLFAVTGNHEYFAGLEHSLRFLRNAGFTVLRGEAVTSGGVILAGVDDASAGRVLQQETKLDTRIALASISKG